MKQTACLAGSAPFLGEEELRQIDGGFVLGGPVPVLVSMIP